MRDVYHASMYRFGEPVPSYWEATEKPEAYPELNTNATAEVAIIGGGYLGLTTALHLARDHGVDVAVLEAGHVGWGASGRNGGFNSGPSMKLTARELIAIYGLEEARRFIATQIEGQDLVAQNAADEGIEIERAGDGIFQVATSGRAYAGLGSYADLMREAFGLEHRLYPRDAFAEIGHDSPEQFGALHRLGGFGIHPLKYAVGLGRAAHRRGARLYQHSRVILWERDGERHRLITAGGNLTARKVLVATNGYMSDGLHPAFDGRVLPAISNIIVTRPLTASELEAHRFRTLTPLFTTRTLLFYYRRLPDNRILFGARGDTSGHPREGQQVRRRMEKRFGDVFPKWRGMAIDYAWRGLIALTAKYTPSMGELEDQPAVWYGFGCHGSGVNNTAWMSRSLARHIAGANIGRDQLTIPAPYRGLPPRLPPIGMWSRRLALKSAYVAYGVRDSWRDRPGGP